MSIDMSQFYQTFFDESFEGLETMESGLLGLDVGAADEETVNTIFRAAHSIKGGSATFGFSAVAEFTHVMETLLDEMRAGTRMVTEPAVDLLLLSVDCLREMLTAVQSETDIDAERVAAVQQDLESLLNGDEVNTNSANLNSATDVVNVDNLEEEKDNLTENNLQENIPSGWKIEFKPYDYLLKTGNDPVRLFRELSMLGKYSSTVNTEYLPLFDDFEPELSYLAWTIEIEGDIKQESVSEIFEWVDEDCELSITPLKVKTSDETQVETESAATTEIVADHVSENTSEVKNNVKEINPPVISPVASQKSPAAKKVDKKSTSADQGSIRVGIDKVDALINMVGELVITQSMLSQLGEDMTAEKIEKMQDGLSQLERNTRELQESVMRIRMLPISFAFQRFPRMVRDLSQQLGKEIDLRLLGEQTELDKTVMEKIGDPLVHLVRNSIDHGIESPDEREAAGKPRVGVVELNAFHQGGNIVIEIDDDGKGIDKEVIRNKGIEKGLISENDVMTDEQIFDLIFAPGFSTAAVVSDVSGRGVGMDVVKRNIRELGGNIEIQSEKGVGSKITIRLPLTLAILDGQLIRVGNDTYIVPLVSIVESLQVRDEQVNGIAGQAELYKLRDNYVPIVRLHDVFTLKPDSEKLTDGLIVIVEGEGNEVGLFVDDLLGQQQVVIKSLETNFRPVEGVSGATILGDGTVALILDVVGLIKLSKQERIKAA
jgi:two-component system chemotaxis sensor kinase CheA